MTPARNRGRGAYMRIYTAAGRRDEGRAARTTRCAVGGGSSTICPGSLSRLARWSNLDTQQALAPRPVPSGRLHWSTRHPLAQRPRATAGRGEGGRHYGITAGVNPWGAAIPPPWGLVMLLRVR